MDRNITEMYTKCELLIFIIISSASRNGIRTAHDFIISQYSYAICKRNTFSDVTDCLIFSNRKYMI